MDARGNIYRGLEEEIPADDKARLDGYLRARAEADEARLMTERMAALQVTIAALAKDRDDAA